MIVDSALFDAGDALFDLGRGFDLVIANTAVTWPAVARLAPVTDLRWYFHEVAQVDRLAEEQTGFAAALLLARELWAGSALSAEALARHGGAAIVVPYGVDDRGLLPAPAGGVTRVGVFGTFERRKGHEIAVCDQILTGASTTKHGRHGNGLKRAQANVVSLKIQARVSTQKRQHSSRTKSSSGTFQVYKHSRGC